MSKDECAFISCDFNFEVFFSPILKVSNKGWTSYGNRVG